VPFQEEIFGPVVSVTTFDRPEQALEIANDTLYGLGSGVWTRDLNMAYRFGRGIKAGRVWTNCYHAYPAHAAFGRYKKSGVGRETHKMMLDHYQQTKNVLVSYSTKTLGFFSPGMGSEAGRLRVSLTGRLGAFVQAMES
jgi:aldehyde dehydrogenase